MNGFPVGNYLAAGHLCAIDPTFFPYGVSHPKVKAILERQGFKRADIDLTSVARERISHTRYKQDASINEAPDEANCRTFLKWVYGQKGIWIPPYIQRLGLIVNKAGVCNGDLVFIKDPQTPSGGHVGMVTSDLTVIHAYPKLNVTETVFEDFIAPGLVAVRRIMVDPANTITFHCPEHLKVEWSGDIAALIGRDFK